MQKLNDNYILVFFAVICFVTSFILKTQLENSYALGEHTFLIFMPFFLYSFYELLINKEKFNIIIFLSFVIFSFLPIYNYLDDLIVHKMGDDSNVFLRSTEYMLNNLTLTFKENSIYSHQPGISYFYALEGLIFGNQNRILQITNITIFFIILFNFVRKITFNLNRNESKILKILILLSSPYIVKNILYTYSEWLTVLLICLLPLIFTKKNNLIFFIILAFIPFIRQNLLIAVLLIFIFLQIKYIINYKKIPILNTFIFFFFLFIPLYHNLYYANSFTFMNENIPILIKNANSVSDYFNIFWLKNNFHYLLEPIFFRFKEILLISHYRIYDLHTMIENKIISIFVLPMILYIFYKIIKNKKYKIIMLILVITSFGPPTILGNQSFPRFEFVNIYFCLTSFYLLNLRKKNI